MCPIRNSNKLLLSMGCHFKLAVFCKWLHIQSKREKMNFRIKRSSIFLVHQI